MKESIIEKTTRAEAPFKIRNSFVKLFTVSYPVNCFKGEASSRSYRLCIQGERMKLMMQTKSTENSGCKFENVWELQLCCCAKVDGNEHVEKVFCLCRNLVELQKSNAIFEGCVIDFITLLQRVFGNINIAHRNNVLKVDLGKSNGQCQRSGCTGTSDPVFEGNESKDFIFDPSLYSFIIEKAQFL